MARSKKASNRRSDRGAHSEYGAEKTPGGAFALFHSSPAANNLRTGNKLALQSLVESSKDLVRFYSSRLDQDVQTLKALSSCKVPREYMEVWQASVSKMAHDYADEFDRLLAINMESAAAFTQQVEDAGQPVGTEPSAQ